VSVRAKSLIARRPHLLVAATWSVALVLGALWLKLSHPEERRPWLAAILGSEPCHVVGHLFLYGSLALLVRFAVGRRPVIVVLSVLAIGFAQETAQVFHVRRYGGAEAFDLCVDVLAALVVLGALHLRERLQSRASRAESADFTSQGAMDAGEQRPSSP
jgi:hypothetical protein